MLVEIPMCNQKTAQNEEHIHADVPFFDKRFQPSWENGIIKRKKMQHKNHPRSNRAKACKSGNDGFWLGFQFQEIFCNRIFIFFKIRKVILF